MGAYPLIYDEQIAYRVATIGCGEGIFARIKFMTVTPRKKFAPKLTEPLRPKPCEDSAKSTGLTWEHLEPGVQYIT
jgi:hypothetical protein